MNDSEAERASSDASDSPSRGSRTPDRYTGFLRASGAIVCGIVAGVLLASSMQVGVSFGVAGRNDQDWTTMIWADHWVWRAIASIAATAAASFLAGMVARRRGRLTASLSALPTVLYWAFVSYIGWVGRIPGSDSVADVPIGYRIVALILVVITLPIAAAVGQDGAAFGRANASHFDARRRSLLGVRWYHFLWIPFLLHLMVMTGAFGAVYGFQWLVTAWRNGVSLFVFIPFMFFGAMLATLQLLCTGAIKAYEAIAGFDDGSHTSVGARVLKFGVGYTLATIAAQVAISAVHLGLAALVRKLFG